VAKAARMVKAEQQHGGHVGGLKARRRGARITCRIYLFRAGTRGFVVQPEKPHTPAAVGGVAVRQNQLRRSHADRPEFNHPLHRRQLALRRALQPGGSFDTTAGSLEDMFKFNRGRDVDERTGVVLSDND
jgi:hypothetical protein